MAQGAKPGEGGELPGYKVTKVCIYSKVKIEVNLFLEYFYYHSLPIYVFCIYIYLLISQSLGR